MVKGAARTATPQASQSLPTMQTGQNPLDPLTQLNSHRGYGAMAGLNPFADMGLNANDPNMVRRAQSRLSTPSHLRLLQMQTMMNSPQFLQQMSSMMSNPAVMDQIISSNPQLAAIAPQIREAFQSEQFREMMYVVVYPSTQPFSPLPLTSANPERLQQMLQMASMFNGAGGGNPFGASPFGDGNIGGGFPAPGTPANASASAPGSPPTAAPFNMFGGPGLGAGAGAPPANPLGMNPAMMQQLLAGGGPFGGGMGGYGGVPAAPVAPADTRPPEERFQVQLQVSAVLRSRPMIFPCFDSVYHGPF